MSKLTIIEVTQIVGNARFENMIIVNNVERFIRKDKTITIKFISGETIEVDPETLDTRYLT